MKTLYKKDSKGKIRIWKIETKLNQLIEYSGLKDGKLVKHVKICKGKNIDKSNETTPEEQAKLEMESRYKSKLDEGYFKTINEAKNNLVVLPMLAKEYKKEKHKIDWRNSYIQPKLDGMRCLATIIPPESPESGNIVMLISRDGKKIENMDHIIKELSKIKTKDKLILDGELYSHGLSFQENMKLIKKYRKNETEKIKYHIFDVVSDLSFTFRYNSILNLIEPRKFKNVLLVETFCLTEDSLETFHNINLHNGYEGSIIRWGEDGYKINCRSENLLKYKDFQDITAKIIDIIPAEQKPEWGVPILEYNGKKFKAGTKISHEEREDFLKNKHLYINKLAEIRFFEYTDDGLPRFPIMVGLRYELQ